MPEVINNTPPLELPINKPKPNRSIVPDSKRRVEPLRIQEQSGTGSPCILVPPGDSLWKIVTRQLVVDHFNNLGLSTKPDDMIDKLRQLNPLLDKNPDLINTDQLIILPESLDSKNNRPKVPNPFNRLEGLNKEPVNPFDKLI